MPTVTTAWGARLDELLADDEWHEVNELLAVLMPLVPPGVAYREGERRRLGSHGRSKGTSPASRHQGNRATAVAAGQRSLVVQVIRSRVRHGRAERDADRVRRRP